VSRGSAADYRGALEAVERILNRGGNADDVVRAALGALRSRRISPARVRLAGNDGLVDGRGVGEDEGLIVVPIVYEHAEVGSLALAADDRGFAERVATLISPYVVRLERGVDR
jgi:hypothetical protein